MKKTFSLALAAVLTMSALVSCGGDSSEGSTSPVTGDALKEDKLVTLDVVMMGSDKKDQDIVLEEVNKILEEQLNINMALTMVSYGNFVQQSSLMLSSGEGADILPIYMTPLATCANNGQIIPLDDLLAKYGQGIIDAIGEDFINCGKVGDEIYGLTTGRDLAKAYGFEMRKDLCDKYGIDYANITTLDQLEEALYTIKENEPDIIPVVPSNGELVRNWGWDTLGDDMTNLGVLMDMGKELKVVNLYETDYYKDFVTRMRKWYNDGLIMADGVSNTENVGTMMKAGSAFGGFMNLKPGFDVQETRNYATEIVVSEIIPAYSTTSDVQMATWAISNGCDNPDAAMKLLNVMYTDPTVSNLLLYGIEGDHYVVKGDASNGQKIISYPDGIDASTSDYPASGGWLWCNQTVGHVWEGNPADYWEVQTEFNNTATKSAAFGFTYDSSPVRNQVTACTNVVAKYHDALMCGALDPETTLPVFNKELKAAGIDDIIAEKQKQLDEWSASQK